MNVTAQNQFLWKRKKGGERGKCEGVTMEKILNCRRITFHLYKIWPF